MYTLLTLKKDGSGWVFTNASSNLKELTSRTSTHLFWVINKQENDRHKIIKHAEPKTAWECDLVNKGWM